MPSLQEIIQQRLDEATKQAAKTTQVEDIKVKTPEESPEDKGTEEVVDLKPKMKKEVVKEEYEIDDDYIVEGFLKNKALDFIHKIKGAATGKDVASDHIQSLADKMNTRLTAKANIRKNRGDFTDAEFAKHQDDIKKTVNHIAGAKTASDAANRVKYMQDTHPQLFEDITEQKSSVSDQVSALLEAEGLSDEFKLQAVTIFEAAVADRVLQIEEAMKQDFETQLSEAIESLNNEIDEFLSEAVRTWQKDNEVAIKANFNTQVNESFMDGLRQLIAEHNVEVPEGKEDALKTALVEVEELQESIKKQEEKQIELQEQIKQLEGKSILESFRSKMTQVEFDRFVQLTESVKFDNADQYEKQLNIVRENFGSKKPEVKQVTESVIPKETKEATIVESTSSPQMSHYVAALKQGR